MKLTTFHITMLGLTLLSSSGCSRQPFVSEPERSKQSAPLARPAGEPIQRRSVGRPARPVEDESSRDSYSREIDRNGDRSETRVKGRSKLHSAEIIAGTAGVGAAIGALAGGGKGAAIGAIAGGGGGLIYDRATAHKATAK